MLRTVRVFMSPLVHKQSARLGALLLLTSSIAGCSADIGRFDLTSVGANESRTTTASVPLPAEPMRRNVGAPVDNSDNEPASPPRPYYGRDPVTGRAERTYGAPDRTAGYTTPSRGLPPPAATHDRVRPAAHPAPSTAPASASASPDALVEVKAGDTLYRIAGRHKVSVSELMSVNGLQNATIRPGQKLRLPGGRHSIAHRASVRTARVATVPPRPAVSAPAASVDWAGTHTIASGDSIYRIARRYHVTAAQIQAANGITDPTKLRVGTVIKVPGAATAASTPVASVPPATRPAPREQIAAPAERPAAAPAAATPPPAKVGGGQFTILNQSRPEATDPTPRKVAELGPAATGTRTDVLSDATSSAVSGADKFRWPVKGRIIAGFGKRSDNSQNDGINISVPAGTEVHAAENGEVAYAGDDLKGYGNLILIRHPGNWVSAYAHSEQILVKRGDKIKRGQAIAKAGKTGAVDQPQVHFELRRGSKPVDPMPHLEKP
ncbi:MAG: LysM peptidoglycan-binding domain-containing protein [Hyphomicrobiaceae bacterium]